MSDETQAANKDEAAAQFAITIDEIEDYRFQVKFDKPQYPGLLTDEPPPIGSDSAPNASRLLAVAVGNCLCASFVFSARKTRANLKSIHASVKVWYARNDKGRLRIGKMKVEIAPAYDPADAARIARCIELFEDYCVVTQSVRNGVDVAVEVKS